MDIIELESPEPRDTLLSYPEFSYPIFETIYLPRPGIRPQVSFFEVMERRRTRREFADLPRTALSVLLWTCAKSLRTRHLEMGHKWHHKVVPSAGGRHPIDLLVIEQGTSIDTVYLYNPIAHALSKLLIRKMDDVVGLLSSIKAIVNPEKATIIWFAAQYKRTSSAYKNSTSLMYQDAGVLMGTLGLVSEALGLAFCPIGITGNPWVFRMIQAEDFLRGVGGCLVGSRSNAIG